MAKLVELFSTILPTFYNRLGLLRVDSIANSNFSSIICGFLYVRLFVIYHDYQHRAILQNSKAAHWMMVFLGIYLLAPEQFGSVRTSIITIIIQNLL